MDETKDRGPVFARVAAAVCCLIAVALAGCELPSQGQRLRRLVPAARTFERDIPVPVGFRFVESASEDFSSGGSRMYVRHLYEGEASKYNVRNFYREQMPLQRWTLISDSNVRGEYQMLWEKGREACRLVIRDGRGMVGSEVAEVQVIISQEGRNPRPPARRDNS